VVEKRRNDTVAHAQEVAGDAGNEIDSYQTEGAEKRFAQKSEVPETPHVGGDVEQTDVNEGSSEQAVPLAMQDKDGYIGAVVNELGFGRFAGRDTVKNHPEIDGTVDAKQQIGSRRDKNVPTPLPGVGARHLAFVVGNWVR
jgi:hypothetical protein